MSFHSPCPQEYFFYQGKWNAETVDLFIGLLVNDIKKGAWVVGFANHQELIDAQEFINLHLDKEYSWDDILSLVNMLKKRYTTFMKVLESDGVNWDRRFNHVHAPPEVWDSLFKWDEFTKAFYRKGDASFESLRSLFGEQERLPLGTIVISSDGPAKLGPNSAAAPILIAQSDNEEVTSPIVIGRKPPRKKLFDEETTYACPAAVSEESNTAYLRKNKPKISPKAALRGVGKMKNESSSCASSSPLRLTYSPLGKE